MKVYLTSLAILACTGSANAQVWYTGAGGFTPDGVVQFPNMDPDFQGIGNPYSESGLQFYSPYGTQRNYWAPGFSSDGLYSDTGYLSITRSDGGDMQQIEWQNSSGWGGPGYLWARAYNNGSLVSEADFDITGGMIGGITGFYGATFDEIRVHHYYDSSQRDGRQDYAQNAGTIDNVSWASVPAPGSLALLGLGGLAAARRRR